MKVWRGRGATVVRPASIGPRSVYELDETSGVTFFDSGPELLHIPIVGTWDDLSSDSLVTGVSGTSAYKETSSAYTLLPGNAPAFNATAITVAIYVQENGSPDKAILIAGSGSLTVAPGDFSVEIQPTGLLRGYHVGQDGVLRFFEASAGIAGTNLRDGEAHLVVLTLGSVAGAQLWLDGSLVSTIAANFNAWNNARDKYVGIWTDGIASPLYGAIDRLSIWTRVLSDAEIAALPAANTATLGAEPTPGEAPLAPSLAEWLPSDETASGHDHQSTSATRTAATAPGQARPTRRKFRQRSAAPAPGRPSSPYARRPERSSSGTIRPGLIFPAERLGNRNHAPGARRRWRRDQRRATISQGRARQTAASGRRAG